MGRMFPVEILEQWSKKSNIYVPRKRRPLCLKNMNTERLKQKVDGKYATITTQTVDFSKKTKEVLLKNKKTS